MSESIALHPRAPLLTIDETTAHIVARPGQAEELAAWFRSEGLTCWLDREAAIPGLVVLDFGDPTPAQERCIRRKFATWQRRQPSPEAALRR